MGEVLKMLKSLAGRPIVLGILVAAIVAAIIAWRKADDGS